MNESERPPRHSFLRIDADALARDWPLAPAGEDVAFALDWFSRGLPAIAARCDARVPANTVAAGIATPPAQHKRRLALKLPREALRQVLPPPALDAVVEASPMHRAALSALAERAHAAGIGFRVFGSFAWQQLTGLPYITPASDLDLLWRPAGARQLATGVDLLLHWERATGLRADGEIEFGGGDAVHWREWAGGAEQVLVKHVNGVRIAPRGSLELAEVAAC